MRQKIQNINNAIQEESFQKISNVIYEIKTQNE